MALTQPQRIQISEEMVDFPDKIQSAIDAQAQIGILKADLLVKDGNIKIFFDKYNDIINAYQNEKRWLTGITHTTVTEADVVNSAQKTPGNKFFPIDGSWINFQPKLHPSAIGNPTSSSPNSEGEAISKITTSIDFMVNGQSSSVPDDVLSSPYTPGSGTVQVVVGGQTVNNLIIIKNGSDSGLFKVLSASGTTLTVSEIIPPTTTLPASSDVIENIPGFSNSERNTLTSSSYQNILTETANQIIAQVSLWKTALDNQLAELNNNNDSRTPQSIEINTAKTNINATKSIIDAWQLLPDTGTSGTDSKFVNVNINTLQTEISNRTTFSTIRSSQINTALGTVTQAGNGSFSGNGMYFERFKQINSRINAAGGPLAEYYEKNVADQALAEILNTINATSATYNSELRTEKFTANGNGTNTISVGSITGFSISDSVYIVSNTQPEISGTIVGISGTNIQLSITVSNLYKANEKARIYKQL